MVIGFKKQFIESIMKGSKVHTIREDAKGRWKPGMKMHMATGVRSKSYNCFSDQFNCVSVQQILITSIFGELQIEVDKKDLTDKQIDQLIANDGLTFNEFTEWFLPGNRGVYSGVIIHWTPLKY